MRRTLRETSGGPLSLFAFQDIIFSVTAVLLFATIWFALSTRVQRFSRAADGDGAQPQLTAAIVALAESEAAQRMAQRGPEAAGQGEGTHTALEQWSAHQLAVDDALRVAAELRDRVQAQEGQSAQSVMAMQNEESTWLELQRRLPLAEQQARDALLRIDPTAREAREPLVLVIGGDAIQSVTTSGGTAPTRISAATLEQQLRAIIGERDPASVWLWVGVRPSAALLFERVLTVTRALGYAVHLEPIAEDQEIAMHRPDLARALLD